MLKRISSLLFIAYLLQLQAFGMSSARAAYIKWLPKIALGTSVSISAGIPLYEKCRDLKNYYSDNSAVALLKTFEDFPNTVVDDRTHKTYLHWQEDFKHHLRTTTHHIHVKKYPTHAGIAFRNYNTSIIGLGHNSRYGYDDAYLAQEFQKIPGFIEESQKLMQDSRHSRNLTSAILYHEIAHLENNHAHTQDLLSLGLNTTIHSAAYAAYKILPLFKKLPKSMLGATALSSFYLTAGAVNYSAIKHGENMISRAQEKEADDFAIKHAKIDELRAFSNFFKNSAWYFKNRVVNEEALLKGFITESDLEKAAAENKALQDIVNPESYNQLAAIDEKWQKKFECFSSPQSQDLQSKLARLQIRALHYILHDPQHPFQLDRSVLMEAAAEQKNQQELDEAQSVYDIFRSIAG